MTLTERTNNVLEKLRARNESRVRTYARNQNCGCIVCTCNSERCYGCGAKNCGTHPVGCMPNPVFEVKPEDAMAKALIVAIEKFQFICGFNDSSDEYKVAASALNAILTTLEESL